MEEAFQAGGGVFRALAFIPMRQQQHDATGARPLRFAGRDELVDDDLRAVGEIAELRFPHHKCGRVVERVTVFKPEDRRFRKRTIEHIKRGLSGVDPVERAERFAGFLVVIRRVPVGERSASAVLPTKSDQVPFENQRTERERLPGAPIERFATANVVAALLG